MSMSPAVDWRFGHSSIAQARRWWTVADTQVAETLGVELTAYDVRSVPIHIDGEHQTVFAEGPGLQPVIRLPVTALHTMDPATLEAMAAGGV